MQSPPEDMPAKRSPTRRSRKKQTKSPGFTGWAIIFLSVFIVVFLVSMLLPESGAKKEDKTPAAIRLQLLNGCGINGAAGEMAKILTGTDTEILFDIIDKGNAEVYNFENTRILDRKGDPENVGGFSPAARFIAEILNIHSDHLVLQKLEDNLLDIEVTIIIGTDYKSLRENTQPEVE